VLRSRLAIVSLRYDLVATYFILECPMASFQSEIANLRLHDPTELYVIQPRQSHGEFFLPFGLT